MKNIIILFAISVFSLNAFASAPHGPTDAQIGAMARANSLMAAIEKADGSLLQKSNVRPFYEYEKTGYIVFSDDDFNGIARDMKKIIAQNLPADVTLIIYTQSANKSYQQQLFNTYSSYIPAARLKVLQVNGGGANDFWSRDNTPIPVWNTSTMGLVDARYYYNFEPDSDFAQWWSATIDRHNYFYEGGNFMANGLGDCIVVNRRQSYPGGISDTAAIPDEVFHNKYGCKTLTRLQHLKGIGHADEVVKFMNDKTIVTDTAQYEAVLRGKGFNVVMLPEPDQDFETYINALQVNDVLYVPVFGERGDQTAINAYKSINPSLKIVPINTRRLATQGQGGIHCITMNYPPVPLSSIEQLLAARRE